MAITTVLAIFAFLLNSSVEAQTTGQSGQWQRGRYCDDDFSVTPGNCSSDECSLPVPHVSITTANCTFEGSDVCGFSQDLSDNLDWTRHQASTPSLETGPLHDHTFEVFTGYYMYIETSGVSISYVARLNSYILTGPITPTCVTFWYHMYGFGIGTLEVYVMRNGSRGSPIWTLSGNQDNSWNVANVSLATVSSNTSYQIVFEASVGNFDGDIAIDDFSVAEGSCSQNQPTVADMCTFDNNMCGFSQDNSDNFDWTRYALSTINPGTGPKYDHTLGQAGNYMYLEVTSKSPNDVARLNSNNLTGPITPTCVTFWYHMYGEGIGTLEVYVMRNGSRGSAIWTLSGNQGNSWNIANVTLNAVPCDTPYQIVFEATATDDFRGDIAIDDFSVTPDASVISEWTEWADNGTCSTTCGRGHKMQERTRNCTNSTCCPANFTLSETRTVNCEMCTCPVISEWTEWADNGTCSTTCGRGHKMQERTRNCTNSTCCPANFTSSETRTVNCEMCTCPVISEWTEWADNGTCSTTCGRGHKMQERTRNCTNSTCCPANFTSSETRTVNCEMCTCPVISEWTEWADNGTCSTTCGRGHKMQERTRNCTNSTCCPANFTSSETRTVNCEMCTCPVISEWTEWADNGTCSTTCGRGHKMQERTRNCTNSTCCPANFTSSETRTVNCEMCTCPVIGSWCPWADSDRCSVTCGGGTKTQARTRECTNTCTPPDCVRREERTVSCNCNYPCPSTWNRWSGSGRRNGNRPYGGWRRRTRMKRRRTRMKWPRRWARKPSRWHG